jgi:hypothetical protein
VVRGAELSAGGVAERAARPGRVWGLRLGLGLAGLLAPLLLLEVALRLAGPLLPGSYQTASFVETHPAFGRRNHPGQGWKVSPEFTTWIEVNSKGLRGPEVDYAKPAGEMRLLVLGDSFTFAEQVNQDETYTQRLEDRLNATGGPARFRVLNAGSNGWATANELIFLAKEGVRFSPDVVVVAFYLGNDVSDNYRRVATLQDAEAADLVLGDGITTTLRGILISTFDGDTAALKSVIECAEADEYVGRPPCWPWPISRGPAGCRTRRCGPTCRTC